MYSPSLVDDIIYAFGYNTEFENMNARDAISIIQHDFLEDIDYYALAGGMSQLVDRLVAKISGHNVDILLNTCVKRHTVSGRHNVSLLVGANGERVIHSDHTIFCVTKDALMNIQGLCDRNPVLRKSLETVGASPLLRIFAKFPCDTEGSLVWFHDIKRTSTNNMLRYIIPLNYKDGVIMISYTDGYHADVWNSLRGARALEENIMIHLRSLFPNKKISNPLWVRKYYWREGAHYWQQNPMKYKNSENSAYTICGEVVSIENHGWIEGALDSVRRGLRFALTT
jgi:hypothetical protein